MDTEKLRARAGHKVANILDMAVGDSTLAEIGEFLGGGGQYDPNCKKGGAGSCGCVECGVRGRPSGGEGQPMVNTDHAPNEKH